VFPLVCSSFLKTTSNPASAGFFFGLGTQFVRAGASAAAAPASLVGRTSAADRCKPINAIADEAVPVLDVLPDVRWR
jgi:hypothetical protein